jgi:hypothetical protein
MTTTTSVILSAILELMRTTRLALALANLESFEPPDDNFSDTSSDLGVDDDDDEAGADFGEPDESEESDEPAADFAQSGSCCKKAHGGRVERQVPSPPSITIPKT